MKYARSIVKMDGTTIIRKMIFIVPTLKGEPMNDDSISRKAAINALANYIHNVDKVFSTGLMSADDCKDAAHSVLDALPAAQPPLEEFEWCTDCKEHDQKAHCCHRYTKVIRKTMEELKVVRCKDCKWFGDIGCAIKIVDDSDRPSEYDFCSFAERKDNG